MRRFSWAALALALLVLSACGGKTVPPPPEEPDSPPEAILPPEPEKPKSPEERREDALRTLVEGMSLEQKVGQVFFVRVPAENAAEDVATYHLGGYLLFGRDTKDKTANEIIQTVASYQKAARYDGIPLLIGVDEEGGTVVRISSNPKLRSGKFSNPRKLWLRGEGEEDAFAGVERETREKNLLLKALGVNVNLNPVADVSTNPGDFMYDRTTGEDVDTACAYVARVVEAQSRDGMGSVLKHFPGYGSNADTHSGVVVDNRPLEDFWQRDFRPFQAGMEAGGGSPPMPAVLVSHNIVNCMDPDLPASLSPEVHRILREELGFDGVVMTDDLAMSAVSRYAADGSAAVMSLQAGNDLVVTADYRTQIPQVIGAVRDGVLPEEAVDAACRRVLRWKLELGLLELSELDTLEPAVFPQG